MIATAPVMVARPALRSGAAQKVSAKAVRPAAGRKAVVCRASLEKKAAAAFSAVASAMVASPALALVDERMNGDGAGIALGVSDPILGAHLLGVVTTIWALYYISQKTSGIAAGGEDEDSGLSL